MTDLLTIPALRAQQEAQARELVDSFGAGSVVLTRPAEPRWNRRQVEFFRANLGAEAWVSGVKTLPPVPGVDFAVAAADAELARRRAAMEAKGAAAWKPVKRERLVSAALQAYAALTTSADTGAVRDVTQVQR